MQSTRSLACNLRALSQSRCHLGQPNGEDSTKSTCHSGSPLAVRLIEDYAFKATNLKNLVLASSPVRIHFSPRPCGNFSGPFLRKLFTPPKSNREEGDCLRVAHNLCAFSDFAPPNQSPVLFDPSTDGQLLSFTTAHWCGKHDLRQVTLHLKNASSS